MLMGGSLISKFWEMRPRGIPPNTHAPLHHLPRILILRLKWVEEYACGLWEKKFYVGLWNQFASLGCENKFY
jgi:hypothetical protein